MSKPFSLLVTFAGCVPRPCFLLLGSEDPNICQHYVQAPNDVKIELLNDPNPTFDTAVVSWRPSYYGMLEQIRTEYSRLEVSVIPEAWVVCVSSRDCLPSRLPGFPAAVGGVGNSLPALPLPPEPHPPSFTRSHGGTDLTTSLCSCW